MVKFNVLTESFIINKDITNQKVVTAEEFDNLMSVSGNVLTFSGSSINLFMDLGAQKSLDKLVYSFTPTSISGLTISYGRDRDSLVSGVLNTVGDTIEVLPTISGYTYPRFFQITHTTDSSTPITLNGIEIYNNEDDIDFGEDGLTESVTVVATANAGYSDVQEILVMNSGTIPTDIYVGVDCHSVDDLQTLEKVELCTTPTGTFQSINDSLSMPDQIPWQWGIFDKVSVTDDNKLKLEDPTITLPEYTLYDEIELVRVSDYELTTYDMIPITFQDGTKVSAVPDGTHRIVFYDPIQNSRTVSSSPAQSPATVYERRGHGLAWDGGDRIYYIFNSTDKQIRYYKISTNTHHILTTTSYYFRASRKLIYLNGSLYITGVRTTAGTETSEGSILLKVDVNTLIETQLTSAPENANPFYTHLAYLNGYIYATFEINSRLYRYNVSTNMWQQMQDLPASNNTKCLFSNNRDGYIWAEQANSFYRFYPVTGQWESSPIIVDTVTSRSVLIGGVCVEDSFIIYQDTTSVYTLTQAIVIGDVPPPSLSITVSGTWTSPIFRLDQTENYHKLLLDYNIDSGAEFKFDNSIGVDNYEFRGSDSPPAADSLIENFDEEIDPDAYLTETLDDNTVITSSGGSLTFGHNYIDNTETPYNAGYLYFGFPLNTTNIMQYKFEWNPASNRISGTERSKFYLVPFLDSLETGDIAKRDPYDLTRTGNDYVIITFGASTDSGGQFTNISVYNGSTTVNYPIQASTGNFYEVNWVINWDTGDYDLYFRGDLLGSGIISQNRIALLKSQHSYEFYSGSSGVDFQDKFRFLTISRVGNNPVEEPNLAVPVHVEDPLFGINGSLKWFPVTVNSSLIPKNKYVQVRFTLRSLGIEPEATISALRFPVVMVLENVQPGETKPIYIRYNFPSANELSTNVINLKAWMYTDKL